MSTRSTGASLPSSSAAADHSSAEGRSAAASSPGGTSAGAAGAGSSGGGSTDFLQLLASAGSGAQGQGSAGTTSGSSDAQSTKPSGKQADAGDATQWLTQSLMPTLGAGMPVQPAPAQTSPAPAGKTSGGSGNNDPEGGAGNSIARLLLSQTAGASAPGTAAGPSTSTQDGGSSSTGASAGASTSSAGSAGTPLQFLTLLAGASGKAAAGADGAVTQDSLSTASTTASLSATPDASQSTASAAAHLASAPAAAALPPMSAELHAAVGTPAWNDELGSHLTWMAHQGIESASLQVTPPDLGPIEARISLHSGAASVWFGASHPDTRAALEQALPRLRDLFAAQGMALADSGVFREPPRQQQPQTLSMVSSAQTQAVESLAAPSPASSARLGLVDLYA